MTDNEKPNLSNGNTDKSTADGATAADQSPTDGLVTFSKRENESEAEYLERFTKMIVNGIVRARHTVFQSHDLLAERDGDTLHVTAKGMSGTTSTPEDDDLVRSSKYIDLNDYSAAVVKRFEDKFGLPEGRPNAHRTPPGEFYVLGAEENGRYVLQGAGYISRDITAQPSANVFKAVFTDKQAYEMFRQWLLAHPSVALGSVFEAILRTGASGEVLEKVDGSNKNGLSFGKMSQAIPLRRGRFAFFDGPVGREPTEYYDKKY